MFGNNSRSRFRIGQNLIFVAIATTIFSLTAAGSNAAVVSFMDSVREFIGIQPVQTRVSAGQPRSGREAPLGTLMPCSTIGASVVPPFDTDYSCSLMGAVPGLPPNYGGLTLKFDDTNTLLIGGSANNSAGRIYQIGVVRDASMHITGFTGTAEVYPSAGATIGSYNDGGVLFGPSNVLFATRFPTNELEQSKVGSTAPDKVIDLTPLGVASSVGSLGFVPSGFPGAGQMKIVSYNGGGWYTAVYVPDGTGTYDITSTTLGPTISGGPEGIAFVPPGSPVFPPFSVLVAQYLTGNIITAPLDANGDPVVASQQLFISGLTGAEGSFIDPITGDFLFSTFGAQNQVVRVIGFQAQSTPTATATNTPTDTPTNTPTATATNTPTPTTTATTTPSATPSPFPELDLTISQMDSPDPVGVNQPLTYTLLATNSPFALGGSACPNVRFDNPTGVPFTFVSAGGDHGFIGVPDANGVTFTGGCLNSSNGVDTATLTVVISPQAEGILTSPGTNVVIDPDNLIPEANENNNTAQTVQTTVVAVTPTPTSTSTSTATATATPTGSPTPIGVFRNSTPICTTLGNPASPYPSTITVAGGPNQIGALRVTFYDFYHVLPDNIDALLVGPLGQKFILMGDAGDSISIDPSAPVTLMFTDAAGQVLPNSSMLTSGSFEPTNWESPVTDFPAPAPPGPYNEPGSAVGGTGLQTLNGNFSFSNSNGVWSLYVRDDAGLFSPEAITGCINGGWELAFLPLTAADVSMSGRVTTADGRGIRNAHVVISGNGLPEARVTTTGSFGYFTFEGLQTGQTYVVTVNSQRYTFSVPSRVITLVDNLADVDFVADP